MYIDPEMHYFAFCGKPVKLSLYRFQLMYFLLSEPEWVHSRERIQGMNGPINVNSKRLVDTEIRRIRRVLTPNHDLSKKIITSVYGVGYRLWRREDVE